MDIFQAYHLLQAHPKGRFWHPRRSRIPRGRWDFQHFRWTGCRFHLGRKPLAFHIRLLSKQHPLRNPSSPVTGATPFRNFENTQLRLPIRVEKHTRFHMLIRNQCEANRHFQFRVRRSNLLKNHHFRIDGKFLRAWEPAGTFERTSPWSESPPHYSVFSYLCNRKNSEDAPLRDQAAETSYAYNTHYVRKSTLVVALAIEYFQDNQLPPLEEVIWL